MSPQNTAPAWDRHSVYSTLKQAQAILNGAGPDILMPAPTPRGSFARPSALRRC